MINKLFPELEIYKNFLKVSEIPKNCSTTKKFKEIIAPNIPVYYVDKENLTVKETRLIDGFPPCRFFTDCRIKLKGRTMAFFISANSYKSDNGLLHTTEETAIRELIQLVIKKSTAIENRIDKLIVKVNRIDKLLNETKVIRKV